VWCAIADGISALALLFRRLQLLHLSGRAGADCPLQKLNPHSFITSGGVTSTSATGYFNAASFTAEPIGSFGNIHRDPYHGPGINHSNIIITKNLPLGTDSVRRLQLRMESDNVFNHTQLSNPTSTFGSSTFGEITSAAAARLTQLSAKFYF
jgi:hypothetical protein